MRMERYVGRTVELIYIGQDQCITQRRIEVRAVEGGIIKAYCLERRAPRIFKTENVLAVRPVIRGAI